MEGNSNSDQNPLQNRNLKLTQKVRNKLAIVRGIDRFNVAVDRRSTACSNYFSVSHQVSRPGDCDLHISSFLASRLGGLPSVLLSNVHVVHFQPTGRSTAMLLPFLFPMSFC